jgi:hypothetical protein
MTGDKRQEIPRSLSEDGGHIAVYGTSGNGRRYKVARKKLTPGEREYLEWLQAKRAAEAATA